MRKDTHLYMRKEVIMAKKEKNTCPRVDIGGQAVLDGVMMKAPDAIAVAVRRPKFCTSLIIYT